MAEALKDITTDNFDTFVKETPVSLVDFSAVWCGPCQQLKPTVEALASDMAGKVNIGKVDIDQHSELATRFEVMSVPTLIFFKNGEKVDSMIGAVPRDQIEDKLNSLM